MSAPIKRSASSGGTNDEPPSKKPQCSGTEPASSAEGEATGRSYYESMKICSQSLAHACQCSDVNCRRLSCHKIKRIVEHRKKCKGAVEASCPICKKLIAVCCYHALPCNRDSCPVLFCLTIRKLKEKKQPQQQQSHANNVLFTTQLVNAQTEASMMQTPTTDPDPMMSSEMMAVSDIFLCPVPVAAEEEAAKCSRHESINRCVQSLLHACQCSDANCQLLSCRKMKRVIEHIKTCKKKFSASCPICKQLISLCHYHAWHCNRVSCLVPFCTTIRERQKQQLQQQQTPADNKMAELSTPSKRSTSQDDPEDQPGSFT